MNFSFYTGFHTKLKEAGIDAAARYAREHGFSGVEFYCDAVARVSAIPDVKTAREVKQGLDANDLSMSCVSVAYDAIACPDAESTMRPYCEIAQALGSPFLHHTLLIKPVATDGDAETRNKLLRAADAAVAIAHMAEAYGLTCLYEDQGRYVNGVKNFVFFYEAVKCRASNVGVCFDTGNILYVNEMPEDFLRAFLAEVKHVHIKDHLLAREAPTDKTGWRKSLGDIFYRDAMPCDGSLALGTCLDMLRHAKYTGSFALELYDPFPRKEALSHAMARLSAHWED